MHPKATLVKTKVRQLSKNWNIELNYVKRGRLAKTYRWIRPFKVSLDACMKSGFTIRLDLISRYHIEAAVKPTIKINKTND